MLRAFSSAVSGMRTQMAFMDVVANNIANVSTTAFKSSRARFADMFYQTLNGGAGPADDLGGVNPTQIGLGVRLAGVDTLMTQGAFRATGNPLDLAIEGEGFFALSDGTNTYYTRDGAFNIDAEGTLVSGANGMKVLDDSGSEITIEPGQYTAINVTPNGTIVGVLADGSGTEDIASIGVTTFPNPGGLSKAGDNLYRESAASGAPDEGAAADPDRGSGSIRAGVLEASNVDLAQEFSNMIAAQRGFQANSRVISTSDEILQDLVNIKR
jgi:flagellar hook protein FlgE